RKAFVERLDRLVESVLDIFRTAKVVPSFGVPGVPFHRALKPFAGVGIATQQNVVQGNNLEIKCAGLCVFGALGELCKRRFCQLISKLWVHNMKGGISGTGSGLRRDAGLNLAKEDEAEKKVAGAGSRVVG